MRTLLLVATTLLLAAASSAATKPTPATAPAGDPSGPRAALLMYDKLVGPNDADKAIGLYHAPATRDRALAEVLAKCDGALAHLRQRAAAKFGAETADAMVRSVDGTTADDINRAKIEVAGDTASVLFPQAKTPATMVRVNGEWKLSVRHMLNNFRSTKPRDLRKSLARLADGINAVADKIHQGQYATAKDASAELKKRYETAFPTTAPTDE
jgi:hypothetical protein